jgi:hypothetical protein
MPASHTAAELLGDINASLSGYYATTPTYSLLDGVERVVDVNFGGNGRISGTVKVKGTPNYAVARRVRLFRDIDGLCVAETWSDATTGAYEFLNISMAYRYTVLAYDYVHTFRVVAADNLPAELMS